ncbi:hypothetical protein CAL14_11485 [Bordetella genomosp. 9]|uniref:glycosyltransferase family 39 protein n=1 Tax=Bordetella genomosp. 9 TaxID=1416803 RepID=UPI000A28EE14|nr:glycosyltransferase family 39 protein [Bordetella genomosp. 9]ARP90831.1 hypothetical protein CAL14_11485 [Bordetella genomosp. 9]
MAKNPALPLPHPPSLHAADTHVARLRLLFALHAVVWTAGAWLYRSNLDWAGDMLENYVWGIEWQAGYHKHPPLFAWITAAWFAVFPRSDAAYFALSNLNALVGLCGIVALAGRFLTPGLAAVAGLAMAVSPIYTTLAIKFNANTVLLSLWPWTAYFFVRYVQSGTRKDAMALGVAAALALLGKYFSVALLAGLAVAGLARPAWRARLLHPHVWLTAMAAAIVLFPHIEWMLHTGMQTIVYARQRMDDVSHPLPVVAADLVRYSLMQAGYLLPSAAFLLLLSGHRRAQAAKLMLHSWTHRILCRDLWWLSIGTFLAICALAFVTRTGLSALWGNTQWFAIVPFWMAILDNAGIAMEQRRIARLMAIYWIVVLALSAAGGIVNAQRHERLTAEPRAELAKLATAIWRERTGQPLAIVSGDDKEARAIAFYGPDRSHYWDLFEPATTPWLTERDVRRAGALLVCREANRGCIDAAQAFTGAAPVAVEVAKTAWGLRLPAHRYLLFVLLPSAVPHAG